MSTLLPATPHLNWTQVNTHGWAQSSTVEATDDFAQQMSQMQDKVKAALKHAADEMAQYYDCWRSPAPAYEVGAKVWLNMQNYMTTPSHQEVGS